MGSNKFQFLHILTYEFLFHEWITLNRSAEAIGRDIGASQRQVLLALKVRGISSALKPPPDRTALIEGGKKSRFYNGMTAPMKGRKGAIPSWKGQTKETNPIVAQITASNRGKKRPNASGPRHHNWKDGATPEARRDRNSMEYARWRTDVFTRDGYTCQTCGATGVFLEAHHIKSFAAHRDLRFDVANGQTLCRPCHKATHHATVATAVQPVEESVLTYIRSATPEPSDLK